MMIFVKLSSTPVTRWASLIRWNTRKVQWQTNQKLTMRTERLEWARSTTEMLGMSCHQSISGRFAGDEALCGYSNRNPKSAHRRTSSNRNVELVTFSLRLALTRNTKRKSFFIDLSAAPCPRSVNYRWTFDSFRSPASGLRSLESLLVDNGDTISSSMQIGRYNLPRESRLNFGDVVEKRNYMFWWKTPTRQPINKKIHVRSRSATIF